MPCFTPHSFALAPPSRPLSSHLPAGGGGLSSHLPLSSPPAHPIPCSQFLAHCSLSCWLACAATASCLSSSKSSLRLLKCQLRGAVIISPASPASPVGAYLQLMAAAGAARAVVVLCKACSTGLPGAARGCPGLPGQQPAVGRQWCRSSHRLHAGVFLCGPAGQLLPQHLPGAVLCIVIGVAPGGGNRPDHILRGSEGACMHDSMTGRSRGRAGVQATKLLASALLPP